MKKFTAKQWIIIIIATLCMFATRFIPPFGGLSDSGLQVIGIMVGGVLLWLFVAVDWCSLYVLFALMTVPALGVNTVIAGSFGNSTAVYLVLCFMLAACLTESGVAKRLAIWFLTNKLSRRNPWNTVMMYFAAVFVLNSFLSSSAGILIMLPILSELLTEVKCRKGVKDGLAAMMMLGTVICGQLANGTTPISHAMSAQGMALYKSYMSAPMDFFTFCVVLIPVGVLCTVLWYFIARFLWKPDVSKLVNLDFDTLSSSLGPMSKKEKVSSLFYILAVIFWVLPGLTKYIAPSAAAFFGSIDQCYPPLIAVILMHLIRVDGEPILKYQNAMKNVAWGSYLFIGSIMMLGAALSNEKVGIREWLPAVLEPVVSNVSPLMFIIVIVVFFGIFTNFASNAVAIAVGFAVAMPLVLTVYQGQINPLLIALLITNASQHAFATPPATPSAAVAAGSGWCDTQDMFKWGMIAAILNMVVLLVVGMGLGNIFCA